jgi:hypothetical protein
LTATESASVSTTEATASAPLSIASLAINTAEGAVVALGWLERKLIDRRSAFGTCDAEFGDVEKLPLRTILIVHFSFRLIC